MFIEMLYLKVELLFSYLYLLCSSYHTMYLLLLYYFDVFAILILIGTVNKVHQITLQVM